MPDDKPGLPYKEALRHGVRFAKGGDQRLVDSVTNQVRIREGDKAAREFKRECDSKGRER